MRKNKETYERDTHYPYLLLLQMAEAGNRANTIFLLCPQSKRVIIIVVIILIIIIIFIIIIIIIISIIIPNYELTSIRMPSSFVTFVRYICYDNISNTLHNAIQLLLIQSFTKSLYL